MIWYVAIESGRCPYRLGYYCSFKGPDPDSKCSMKHCPYKIVIGDAIITDHAKTKDE